MRTFKVWGKQFTKIQLKRIEAANMQLLGVGPKGYYVLINHENPQYLSKEQILNLAN